ncbi:MAG: DUF1460 domain-containing protein [Spirochaetes bacterium]|jgi:hypothetical protein|nr:DUF1460 domain-containing protein [Spirochaetota bacterium]
MRNGGDLTGKMIEKYRILFCLLILAAAACTGCPNKTPELSGGVSDEDMFPPYQKPIYFMSAAEIDRYIRFLSTREKDTVARLDKILLRHVGQDHRQNIIGDFPFDLGPDNLPIYNIKESDCVSFVESVLAMSLADSWRSYMVLLQRIRYRHGLISWENRNHFIEADWQESNRWLIRDVNSVVGAGLLKTYDLEIERDRFYAMNGRKNPFPPQTVRLTYIPADDVHKIIPNLKNGYLFNLIRTNHTGKKWVGHLGFIRVDREGIVYMVHSGIPTVRMLTFSQYLEAQIKDREKRILEQKPYFEGFRFFAVRGDAMARLRRIDGRLAPRIIITGK